MPRLAAILIPAGVASDLDAFREGEAKDVEHRRLGERVDEPVFRNLGSGVQLAEDGPMLVARGGD